MRWAFACAFLLLAGCAQQASPPDTLGKLGVVDDLHPRALAVASSATCASIMSGSGDVVTAAPGFRGAARDVALRFAAAIGKSLDETKPATVFPSGMQIWRTRDGALELRHPYGSAAWYVAYSADDRWEPPTRRPHATPAKLLAAVDQALVGMGVPGDVELHVGFDAGDGEPGLATSLYLDQQAAGQRLGVGGPSEAVLDHGELLFLGLAPVYCMAGGGPAVPREEANATASVAAETLMRHDNRTAASGYTLRDSGVALEVVGPRLVWTATYWYNHPGDKRCSLNASAQVDATTGHTEPATYGGICLH